MCENLFELTQQARLLRESSVLYFNFSLTLLLTIFFMMFYRVVSINKSLIRLVFYASFFFYIMNVIRLVFFPMPINSQYIAILKEQIECGILIPRRHNLELLDFMKWDNLFHITTTGNFALLMPLSFYLPLVFTKIKWNLIKVTMFGFGVSLFIELTQLSYSLVANYIYRSADVDDLMLNTLGVFVGYLVFIIIKSIVVGIRKLRGFIFKVIQKAEQGV